MRLFLGSMIFLFLLLCGGVLFFNLPRGKQLLSNTVKQRTGVKVQYAKLYPKSLNTLTMKGVSSSLSGDATFPKIKVKINLLKSLRTRQLHLAAIDLQKPTIPLDPSKLLKRLKPTRSTPKQQPQAPPSTNHLSPKRPLATSPTSTTPPVFRSPVAPSPKPLSPLPPPKKPTRKLPAVTLQEGDFIFHTPVFPQHRTSLNGVTLQHSHNEKNSSTLTIKSATLFGEHLDLNLELPLIFKDNRLTLPQTVNHLGDLQLTTGGTIALHPLLPFQLVLSFKLSDHLRLQHHLLPSLHLDLDQTSFQLQASGLLTLPTSIKGVLKSNSSNFTLHLSDQFTHQFTEYAAHANLVDGRLSVPHFRLYSPELSLLGNGIATQRSELASILRIVAAPHWEERYRSFCQPLPLPPIAKAMHELETPDRYFKEISFQKTSHGPLKYKFEAQKEWTNLDLLPSPLQSSSEPPLHE